MQDPLFQMNGLKKYMLTYPEEQLDLVIVQVSPAGGTHALGFVQRRQHKVLYSFWTTVLVFSLQLSVVYRLAPENEEVVVRPAEVFNLAIQHKLSSIRGDESGW